jgi:hypothetical protein
MTAPQFCNVQDFNIRSACLRAFLDFFRCRMAKTILFWIAGYYQVFHKSLL